MNLKQAKELVRSRLSDKRYEHTINVKKMAVKLAKHYGADEEQAALAALLRKSGLDPAPYEHTSRLRACLNQYGLLTGCRGDLPYARRRALFAEILADNDARAALQERLRNDPNKILAVPYRIGVAWNWPGLLAAYTLIKQRLL